MGDRTHWNDCWKERTHHDCAAARIAELEAALAAARTIAGEQAEDEGLWFDAQTAPEAYLQQALRRLHAAVEGER